MALEIGRVKIMEIGPIPELKVFTVMDRGVANGECICLRSSSPVQLGNIGVMLGYKMPNGHIYPLKDNMFWLGDSYLGPNDWIFLYTGEGTPQVWDNQDGTGRCHSVFWGRKETVLNRPEVVPVMFRIDGIEVDANDRPAPQISNGSSVTGGHDTQRQPWGLISDS